MTTNESFNRACREETEAEAKFTSALMAMSAAMIAARAAMDSFDTQEGAGVASAMANATAAVAAAIAAAEATTTARRGQFENRGME